MSAAPHIERALERDEALAARGLPPVAYVANTFTSDAAKVLGISRGREGYTPIYSRLSADELNQAAGVTPQQREAMLMGSMFGWHTPAADPSHRMHARAA